MDSQEIDFYLKIEEKLKSELKPIVRVNYFVNTENKNENNQIVVSDCMMNYLLEEFGDVNIKNWEKQEVWERMEEEPEKEIARLKAELTVSVSLKF